MVYGESTVYHVMSRTALEGFPLGDVEKDELLELIKKFSRLYFTDILGFSILGNHWHLLVRMHPEGNYSDSEIKQRFETFHDKKKYLSDFDIPKYREKLSNLSEFIKDIKQRFTRNFNRKRKRWGYFWGQRFKSVIVEQGHTLINCLAYIDLNPIRAGIVQKPEDYRWNTIGYLLQTNNKDRFISMNFGLPAEEKLSIKQRIEKYRRFVYEIGSLESPKGASINKDLLEKEKEKDFKIKQYDRFRQRTRYFTDSGVIGSRKFVRDCGELFADCFTSKRKKGPIPIQGLEECYSLKQLAASKIY